MEILHIENTFSVIIHKIFTNVEKSSARNSRRSSRGFGFALVNLRITNWVPSSPIPHKYSNTSCVDTCESIGRSTSPCGYMTNADKCRQMSTNVHKCPGVSKQPGQMSAVIGQDISFEWQLQWSMTGITGWYSKHQTCEQLAKKLDTGPIPMPKTSQ